MVPGFAVKPRCLVPWLFLFPCLAAAVTPALAREGVDPHAPGRADLQKDANDSTARYRQAKGEVDRLAAEVARIENRLSGVEEKQAALRALATRGAAALYMHDSTVDWLDGFGDGGENALQAAPRARLIRGVHQLARAAVPDPGGSAKQIHADRPRLKERRHEQGDAP